MKFYLGIDIGGTNTAFAIVNQNGDMVFKHSIPTKQYPFPELLIKEIYNNTILFCKKEHILLQGIGIGAPNANHYSGYIEFAPNLKWVDNIPIASMFEEQFKLPVKITNDANAAAIGEKFFWWSKANERFCGVNIGNRLRKWYLC